MSLDWKFKPFNELQIAELYAIMQLRNAVFVVEQNCAYQDADNKDDKSFHLAGWAGHNLLAAYCRILPPGISFTEASIGRVVTSYAHRNSGFGRELMELAIRLTLEQFQCKKITIGAQLYLKKFYGSLGFMQVGETYLEDSIPHIEMQFTL